MSTQQLLPTRLNLLRLKRMKKTSEEIRKILDEKREILLLHLKQSIQEYDRIRVEAEKKILEAYNCLFLAKMKIGAEELESIAFSTPTTTRVERTSRVVFNILIPILRLDEESVPKIYFSPAHTNPIIVETFSKLLQAFQAILKLSEAETTVLRVLEEFKKTQRLINALDNLIIPSYEEQIKYIEMVLEETMREEFSRLKILKRIMYRRRGIA